LAEVLLQLGASASVESSDRSTPLHRAISVGNVRYAQLLLEYKTNINAQDSVYGHTPLHVAVANKKIDCVKLLLDSKASLNVKTGSDNSWVENRDDGCVYMPISATPLECAIFNRKKNKVFSNII